MSIHILFTHTRTSTPIYHIYSVSILNKFLFGWDGFPMGNAEIHKNRILYLFYFLYGGTHSVLTYHVFLGATSFILGATSFILGATSFYHKLPQTTL